MENAIAEITLYSRHRRVEVEHCSNRFTFTCQRCGTFCCKLGAPKLLESDIERIERAGYRAADFLSPDRTTIVSRRDGSCSFLSPCGTSGCYKCLIYAARPALCRLYPFALSKSGRDRYALRLIPACLGVNTKGGEPIDVKFVANLVNPAIFELIEAGEL